jgi:hypothetical protein
MGAEWQENDWVVSVFRRLKKKKKRIQPVGVIFIFLFFVTFRLYCHIPEQSEQ